MGKNGRRLSPRHVGMMLMTLLLLSCSPGSRSAAPQESETKDGTMRTQNTAAVQTQERPLMDMEAPSTWETASFGLG